MASESVVTGRCCTLCRTPITADNGLADRRASDGFAARCRTCHAEAARLRYWSNPARYRARMRERYAANIEAERQRARARNRRRKEGTA
ncbi:hypothetical protein GCM10028772_17150 [Nocardioides ultimimeridianus]